MPRSTSIAASKADRRAVEIGFLVGVGRAVGGAVVFALPVLMTMEMWSFGASLEPGRLAAILALLLPLLVGLSHYVGFEETETWADDVRDALVAIAVGFVTSAVVLALFGLIEPGLSFDENLGSVVIQTVPASFGAALAQGQFGQQDATDDRRTREAGFSGELLFMAAGAAFLSFSVSPTEEIDLIAAEMTPLHAIALVLVSIAALHAVVYMLGFRGQADRRPEGLGFWALLGRRTLAGYAVALLVSGVILWAFGRFDDVGFEAALRLVVVLGFPAAVGAAFARLIV